jgi:hypothetical protein
MKIRAGDLDMAWRHQFANDADMQKLMFVPVWKILCAALNDGVQFKKSYHGADNRFIHKHLKHTKIQIMVDNAYMRGYHKARYHKDKKYKAYARVRRERVVRKCAQHGVASPRDAPGYRWR